MVMEFKIGDVTEKFRTLKMYHQNVEADKMDEAFNLLERWNELVWDAKRKDFKLNEKKKEFAEVTKDQVKQLRETIKSIISQLIFLFSPLQRLQSHRPWSPRYNPG